MREKNRDRQRRERESERAVTWFEFRLVLNPGSTSRSCVTLCFDLQLHSEAETGVVVIPDFMGMLGNIKCNTVCRLCNQPAQVKILAQWFSY